jgi:hypothetical protein
MVVMGSAPAERASSINSSILAEVALAEIHTD